MSNESAAKIVSHELMSKFTGLLRNSEKAILTAWIRIQTTDNESFRQDLTSPRELMGEGSDFLGRFITSLENAPNFENLSSSVWQPVRDFLQTLSVTRGEQGFSPSETAMFIFALKQSLFEALRATESFRSPEFQDCFWAVSSLLDKLGLFTFETFVKTREQIINRQQSEMLELSTPVVKLWDGILALPMIGTLDSGRTQMVMEALLQKVVETNSELAIIDITGVPTVDTLVAQHLIKTVTAARLMGAECIISGIRPQIAATIVHLGVDLGNIITKATLADAFKVALTKQGRGIGRLTDAKVRMSETK